MQVEGLYLLYPVDDHRQRIDCARAACVPLGPLPAPDQAPAALSVAVVPAPAVARASLDELAALAGTSFALAKQIIAYVPVLLDTADALLRTSERANQAITAIRDLMK